MGSGRLDEMKPRWNHLRVVENNYRLLWKKVRQVTKDKFIDLPVAVPKKFGCIPLRKGIFGYPLFRERIGVVFYMNLRNHSLLLISGTKLINSAKMRKSL